MSLRFVRFGTKGSRLLAMALVPLLPLAIAYGGHGGGHGGGGHGGGGHVGGGGHMGGGHVSGGHVGGRGHFSGMGHHSSGIHFAPSHSFHSSPMIHSAPVTRSSSIHSGNISGHIGQIHSSSIHSSTIRSNPTISRPLSHSPSANIGQSGIASQPAVVGNHIGTSAHNHSPGIDRVLHGTGSVGQASQSLSHGASKIGSHMHGANVVNPSTHGSNPLNGIQHSANKPIVSGTHSTTLNHSANSLLSSGQNHSHGMNHAHSGQTQVHHPQNLVIHQTPSWAKGHTPHTNVNQQLKGVLSTSGISNQFNHQKHHQHWNNWGSHVRGYHHRHFYNLGFYAGGWPYFGSNWWNNYSYPVGGWRYWGPQNRWSYWYACPTWNGLSTWLYGSYPRPAIWNSPLYYNFGTGGNFVLNPTGNVVVAGQSLGSLDDLALSAADLATVPNPTEEEAAKSEWMPLGTFSLSVSEDDKEPNRVIQLAISKEGIISGTLYNRETDEVESVQGRVDRETQRVAFRVGESDKMIFETGIANLTDEQAPVLVHLGADEVQTWLLVRMYLPEGAEQQK